MKKTLIQFIKFGLVGVSNTLVNYVVYALVFRFMGNYYLANVAGWLISVVNAYVWQNIFVFKADEQGEKRVWWQVLLKTYMAYAFTGLVVNNVLLWLWLDALNISVFCEGITQWLAQRQIFMSADDFAAYIAPFLNMGITIPINFVTNKFWAYRQKGIKK